MSQDDAKLIDRIKGALWGIFIADALSMPAHWYYNHDDLVADFGVIKGYEAPKELHPSSIMQDMSVGGSNKRDVPASKPTRKIIGEVINHDKDKFWGVKNVHYHHGMAAGENTLNACCARLVLRSVVAHGGYRPQDYLQDYVTFMTKPGSHNDTYAENYHRYFFKRWAEGIPPAECGKQVADDPEQSFNAAQIGGFVTLPPVIIASLSEGRARTQEIAKEHLTLTHDCSKLASYAQHYIDLLYSLLTEESDLPAAAIAAAKAIDVDVAEVLSRQLSDTEVTFSVFGPACYIEKSFPLMCYFALKYSGSFEDAVLANTNVGGENCHRGSALGAVMGAALGESAIPPRLKDGLVASAKIRSEIDAFVSVLFPTA